MKNKQGIFMFKVPNEYRLRTGIMGSSDSIGNKGAFHVPYVKKGKGLCTKKVLLVCICSDELGWEHVSCYKIYKNERFIPSWNEMCFVKGLFWDDKDCVMQLHPAKSDYVNFNPFVLHLWRPIGKDIPLPPKAMV